MIHIALDAIRCALHHFRAPVFFVRIHLIRFDRAIFLLELVEVLLYMPQQVIWGYVQVVTSLEASLITLAVILFP